MIANETTLHRDQMTQKLTTIGHHMAFKYEQSPYRIVSYKRPRNNKCSKQFKREIFMYKN